MKDFEKKLDAEFDITGVQVFHDNKLVTHHSPKKIVNGRQLISDLLEVTARRDEYNKAIENMQRLLNGEEV